MILGFISTEGTLLVCPKDTVVVMVNGFGAGSAIQPFSIPTRIFPQEMHFLVILNFILIIPYVFWLCVTSAYFQLLRPFNF